MRALALVTGLSIVLLGCANKEHWDKYYALQTQNTNAIINSIERQATANAAQQTSQMSYYGNAAVAAAKTTSSTDDVLVAFAWGYRMAQPFNIKLPSLPTVEAPDKHSDIVRAWTPIVGMAAPFLYPLAYGWADSSSSGDTAQVYSVEGGGDLLVNSANSGSQNSRSYVGTGDYTNNFKTEETCVENCGEDDGDLNINPVVGEPGYECAPGEMVTPTCSCVSRQNGIC